MLAERLRLLMVLETSMLNLPLGDFIMQAVEGGVTAIKLRDKNSTEAERFAVAKQISSLLKSTNALFIVNDSPDIAKAVGADGVHLGTEDIPADAVKKLFPDLIVGYSCNNSDDCVYAEKAGANYISLGPVFTVPSKNSLKVILGVEGANDLAKSTTLPAVATGGITPDNIALFKNTALAGVTLSSATYRFESPYDCAIEMRKVLSY